MKSIQLKQTSSSVQGESRYYADSRRITREQFQLIKAEAASLDCIQTVQVNGAWQHYCIARIQQQQQPS